MTKTTTKYSFLTIALVLIGAHAENTTGATVYSSAYVEIGGPTLWNRPQGERVASDQDRRVNASSSSSRAAIAGASALGTAVGGANLRQGEVFLTGARNHNADDGARSSAMAGFSDVIRFVGVPIDSNDRFATLSLGFAYEWSGDAAGPSERVGFQMSVGTCGDIECLTDVPGGGFGIARSWGTPFFQFDNGIVASSLNLQVPLNTADTFDNTWLLSVDANLEMGQAFNRSDRPFSTLVSTVDGRSAQLRIDVPAGVTWHSGSGLLLTPVPVPAPAALMVSALCLLGMFRLRGEV